MFLTPKYTKNCYSDSVLPLLLMLFFNQINPIMPETNDATSIINLALLIKSLSSKAIKVMKMDMVNPIPPKNPIPNNEFQFMSSGNEVNFSLTAKKQNIKIPTVFPNPNPKMMPNEYGFAKLCIQSLPITIAVLLKAKSGIIIKATGLCNQCCS